MGGLYSGPQTNQWYVRPGRYKVYTLAGVGGGAFIFDFWNVVDNMIYTYGFAGVGGVKTSLKYLGLAGKYDGTEVGNWLALDPKRAFSSEELDGASGRLEKVGLSVMGLGHISCRITAYTGITTTYFSAAEVQVRLTHFFSFPGMVLQGTWEQLDVNPQRANKSEDVLGDASLG
jgi:hypothetical protein